MADYMKPVGEKALPIWGMWRYRFYVYFKDGEWFWQVVEYSGDVVARSVRGYATSDEASEAAWAINPRMPTYTFDEDGSLVGGRVAGSIK